MTLADRILQDLRKIERQCIGATFEAGESAYIMSKLDAVKHVVFIATKTWDEGRRR